MDAPRSTDSIPHYDPVAKWLHWGVFVLLVIEYTLAWTMPHVKRGEEPTGLVSMHLSVGMLIVFLIVLRIAWRYLHTPPSLADVLPKAHARLAVAMHYLLYGVLLLIPFSGWFWASARGWDVTLFGIIPLPALVTQGSSLGRTAGAIHEALAALLIIAVIGHAGAALYHHVVRKDNILRRMLPGR